MTEERSDEDVGTANRRAARSGWSGLGYVDHVVALDVDQGKVDAIRHGRSTSRTSRLSALQAVGDRLTPTRRAAELTEVESIIICVATPLSPNREPELGPLLQSASSVR